MNDKRSFWIKLSLVNLCIVALLGFTLRSKILFSLPLINYRNFLSAHSHFAFAGWAGLGLITLLIFDILPAEKANKKIYQWLLAAFEISSLGMAFTFPFQGYAFLSILFSTSYIFTSVAFAIVFLKHLFQSSVHRNIKLLSICAIASFIISYLGTLGLVYILLSHSGNSILYRDSIYVFLHFQYNGFFTLSVFALFFNMLYKKGVNDKFVNRFVFYLCLSIIPTMFLALLWHNSYLFYGIGFLGCVLNFITLIYFTRLLSSLEKRKLFTYRFAYILCIFSFLSFGIKMCLQIGTIIPQLANAVYGDRPIIIGFLHLVFLGFVTFYMLGNFIESAYFTLNKRLISFPFYLFSFAIIYNEALLMIQGLGILFKTNNHLYSVLLWTASILLFLGAASILIARYAGTKMRDRQDHPLPR
jgi:hypothetical protein